MSAAAQQGQQPSGGTVHKMPEVVIDETRFEGKEVAATSCTLAGAAKLIPESAQHENTVLTVDDIVTIQLDVKVTGVYYDINGDGFLVRNQRIRPIEGTVRIVDVVRDRDTKIR